MFCSARYIENEEKKLEVHPYAGSSASLTWSCFKKSINNILFDEIINDNEELYTKNITDFEKKTKKRHSLAGKLLIGGEYCKEVG